MAKRWSAEDISDLKALAQKYSVQAIAEKMDRTVGGVAFKAHRLGLPLKRAHGPPIRSPRISIGQRATTGRLRLTNATEATPAALAAKFGSDAVSAASPSRCGRHPAHGRRRCPR